MKIDGNQIAQQILNSLRKEIEKLKERRITPSLAILLVDDDPASKSYVEQKELKAKEIGIKTTVFRFSSSVLREDIETEVNKLNNDNSINGIVIQRPLPQQIDYEFATNVIVKEKDVDGFRKDSRYQPPIARAVGKILEEIFGKIEQKSSFLDFLKSKKITVIGKGETGGKPIIKFLEKQGIKPTVIDTKTENPEGLVKQSDILISTVGKPNTVDPKSFKKDVILIPVGMCKDKSGRFHTDYDQTEAERIASFYSPVPGGVGPVNVAMLLENVIESAKTSDSR